MSLSSVLLCGVDTVKRGLGHAVEYDCQKHDTEPGNQPDAQFQEPGNPLGLALHAGGWGLTMGQLLCLPMIALGAALIVRARRRGAAPQPA